MIHIFYWEDVEVVETLEYFSVELHSFHYFARIRKKMIDMDYKRFERSRIEGRERIKKLDKKLCSKFPWVLVR
jgi:hypothetical protein